jgi:S1-C subfamily serine protease
MGCPAQSKSQKRTFLRPRAFPELYLLLSILLFGLLPDVQADIYRYRDENGVWHFSLVRSDPRYELYIRTYPVTPEAAAQEQIKRAQMLLGKLGYTPGPSDGVMGEKTIQAIKAFQRDIGIPVTGVVDESLIKRLELEVLHRLSDQKRLPAPRSMKQPPRTALVMPVMASNVGSTPLTPSVLFQKVQSSIYTVLAAGSTNSAMKAGDLRQGSAVAISTNLLLTNFHVVKEGYSILVRQGERETIGKIVAKDEARDTCVLAVENSLLSPVRSMQIFEKLAVGQKAYTIGAPFGLENTLGDGLISGLRVVEGRKLIQTTAQISNGSSGGGLFDDCGNLVGITTFRIRDGQNINFAIAASQYWE